jgi:uncharacterized protein (TIGR02391 family)
MMPEVFTQSQIQAIADALGDTSEGLSGSEIGHLLDTCGMSDLSPAMTKRHRLYNAFVESQNKRQDRRAILAFIRRSMKPELYAREPQRYEPMRTIVNLALAFAGLAVDSSGELVRVERAQTLSEAQRRASELRVDLEIRKVHPDVLRFCREELLVDNYFHAALEATKSVADKLRSRTGLTDDGGTLVDRALGGYLPLLAINALEDESEKAEQRGFANIVKGVFGMFRHPPAHAPKIAWAINRADAEEMFVLLSMIHKRIDAARTPPRA